MFLGGTVFRFAVVFLAGRGALFNVPERVVRRDQGHDFEAGVTLGSYLVCLGVLHGAGSDVQH
jgi:hypothetical protein